MTDNRIQQLLAVIELQRQALKYYADGGHIRHLSNGECAFEYGDIAQSAFAIKPQDVELVKVGEADFDKPAGTVNLDIYNIDFDGMHKLYTIKTKE